MSNHDIEYDKEIFAKNLDYYMSLKKIKPADLCELLGVAKSTVSAWNNAQKIPRMDKIEKLAVYFGINKSDLIEDKKEKTKPKGVNIPVLGYVAAGVPIDAIEDIVNYEEISLEMASKGEHFGLVIKGDSMEPRICNGDVVIVRKQSDVETGQIAVVLVNGGEATVKKIKLRHDGIMLIPTNQDFEPMFYSQQEIQKLPVKIIGRVVELRAKL